MSESAWRNKKTQTRKEHCVTIIIVFFELLKIIIKKIKLLFFEIASGILQREVFNAKVVFINTIT